SGRPLLRRHGGHRRRRCIARQSYIPRLLGCLCSKERRCPGQLRAAGEPATRIRQRIHIGALAGQHFWRQSGRRGRGRCARHADADRLLHPALTLNGGIDRVKKKSFIYCNVPAPTTLTPFYEKLKDDPDWSIHTLPCTHIVQMEMPNELTELLLQAAA